MDVGDQQSRELVFAALADQVRREILDTLASHGECSAGFISEHIPSVGRTTVSAHLKALKMSGVIVERRAGRNRFFSIDPVGPANDALQFLRDVLERSLVAPQISGDPPGSVHAGSADTGHAARRRA